MKSNNIKISLKLVLSFILLFFSSQFIGQNSSEKLTEESATEAIWHLEEVQERNKFVSKESKGKRSLSIVVFQTNEEFYWLKVTEDNGSNLYTHFNFYAFIESGKIMFVDPVSGKELELSEWRKN